MLRKETVFYRVIRTAIIVIALVVVVVPFVYLFTNSIKLEKDFRADPFVFFPKEVTFEYYAQIFGNDSDLSKYFLNSIIVTLSVVAVSVVTGTLAAFGLSHLRKFYRWVGALIYIILLVRFYPKVVLVIPYFTLMKTFSLLDTRLAVILAHSSIGIPFVVWLMIGFYDKIPKELEESAMIDGCGVWKRFLQVIFPVVIPGVATSAIMSAILSWNEFLITSSVVSIHATTLPVLLSGYISDKGIAWGPMSAVSSIIIFPMFIFVFFAQKYLIRGLTFGAVKE
jgi:multiple sugar transport system permease protein